MSNTPLTKNKYNQDRAINVLARKGLKPVFGQGRILSNFTTNNSNLELGIKCLAYLDFLNVGLIRPRPKKNSGYREVKKRASKPIKPRASAWHYKWFNNRDDALGYIEQQKSNRHFAFEIKESNAYLTDNGDFRVEIKGLEFLQESTSI